MPTDPLLETKFAIPRAPPAAVVRPRLLHALDAGARGPLTLVAAPAGAGKSALVGSWVAAGRAPGPVAWLSLDETDADRRRFWRGVAGALRRAGIDAPPRLEPAELVNALAARDDPVVLVLDDFHAVSGGVERDIERLLRFPAPGLRIVVLTRADPQLGLGRLRLEGHLAEVRARDLAFTRAEAGELLARAKIALSEEDVTRLWRRTEGWAAALRLAALSLERHAAPADFVERFAGTDATISDYLVSEVLAAQAPELRDFLLRTSVADALSAGLAGALTGRADAGRLLARLERDGALIAALDEQGTWYRYHPLFAELLRAELGAELPGDVQGLHRRAAVWLAAHGDDGRAVRHAAQAGAWDLAAELISDRWVHLLVTGELSAVRTALEDMPADAVADDPEIDLAWGAVLLSEGDEERAAAHLRRAEAGEERVPAPRRARFAAAMAATRLYEGRLRGELGAALRAARELLDRHRVFEGDVVAAELRSLALANLGIVELWTGDLAAARANLERAHAAAIDAQREWLVLLTAAHLAVGAMFRGDVGRALRRAEEAVRIAGRRGWSHTSAAGAAFGVLGAVAIQRQRLDDAERALERADLALQTTRERPLRATHALNRAMLLADRGDPDAALDVLRAGRDELGDWPLLAPLLQAFTAHEALLEDAIGERAEARALLERAGTPAGSVSVALARLRLHDGEPLVTRELLAPGLAAGNGDPGFLALRTEAWMLDALALDALADHDAAARSLEHALDLAEPADLRRALLTHGASARALLSRQRRLGTAHPALVREALEVLDRRDGNGRRAPVLLAEPLSDRERAILRYLPTMMSNQEIAGELYVSVNTVKTHLKAIYRKLDAPGRREAVRRAREAGLLPH